MASKRESRFSISPPPSGKSAASAGSGEARFWFSRRSIRYGRSTPHERQCRNTVRQKHPFRCFRVPRKRFTACAISLASRTRCGSVPPGMHSASSSSTRSISDPPRLAARASRKRETARFLVTRESQAENSFGFSGGMAFQACSQVSLTHSSESSRLFRMRSATQKQSRPYFASVSVSAAACRSR